MHNPFIHLMLYNAYIWIFSSFALDAESAMRINALYVGRVNFKKILFLMISLKSNKKELMVNTLIYSSTIESYSSNWFPKIISRSRNIFLQPTTYSLVENSDTDTLSIHQLIDNSKVNKFTYSSSLASLAHLIKINS